MLIAKSDEFESIDDVKATAADIRRALTPKGLKSIEVVPDGQPGQFQVMVAASEKKPVAKVKEQKAADNEAPHGGVSAHANVTFKEAARLEGHTFGTHYTRVGDKMVEAGKLPAGIKGGKVMPPEEGGTKVNVYTSSGKTLNKAANNTSHAERHIADWILERLKHEDRVRISSISLITTGKFAPCRNCAADLSRLAAIVTTDTNKEAKLTFDYSKVEGVYTKHFKTDKETEEAISGWELTPYVKPPEKGKVKVNRA
jgi:hypothetical protein